MAILEQLAGALGNGTVEVIDLSHTLSPNTHRFLVPAQYEQGAAFKMESISEYDERGPEWYWNNFSCSEHSGTHFDAPSHWISGKDYPDAFTDTIHVSKFVAPACVIDVSTKVDENRDYATTIADVEEWEAEHGRIPAGAWVLIRTGWSSRMYTDEFLGWALDGGHWPGQHPELPPFLLHERDVMGVGSEAIGTDAGQANMMSPHLPCHANMHGGNRFGLSSLANLDLLPPKGALLVTPPLKIKRGSGSPLRVLALVER